jgi:MFS family permease
MLQSLILLFIGTVSLSRGLSVLQFSPHRGTRQLKPITRTFAATESPDIQESQSTGGLPPWLPAFGTAALGGLLFGSDIGSSSSVVRILGSGATDLGVLDPLQLGQIASASLLGATAASGAIIFAGDKNIGRKTELITAATLFGLGTLGQSLGGSLSAVLAGRVLYGLGIGVAMHVAPLYIAETSPDKLRGKLVSLKEAAIVGGIVLGYLAGAVLGKDAGWREVFECALPIEALMLAGALAVPESPRWLALRGRQKEASAAFQKVQGVSEAEAAILVQNMQRMAAADQSKVSLAESSGQQENDLSLKLSEIFGSPYNRQALTIGVGLVLFQQLSGQPSVLYFANRIFEDAGFGFEAAVGVGVFKFVMTLVSAALVESPNWGRRSLLLVGNSVVTASLVGLAASYGLAGADGPNQVAVIAFILAFVGGYQIGFGPMTWLVLSEGAFFYMS